MALCAAAWVNVAGACPCMEYSGSGTETVRFTATKNNWKLSTTEIKKFKIYSCNFREKCIYYIVERFPGVFDTPDILNLHLLIGIPTFLY